MNICGLHKLTLLDYPGRVACTIFTKGCNYRCPFCHNFDLATGAIQTQIDEDILLDFIAKRRNLYQGIAVTGGEPCVQPDLEEFMRKLKGLGYSVKLDTNGSKPRVLKRLLEEKLVDYVAMDIKNRFEKYSITCGVQHCDTKNVEESIELLNSSSIEHEFRTTVVEKFHRVDDIEFIAGMIKGSAPYYIQPFVDRDSVPINGLRAPSEETLEQMVSHAKKVNPNTYLRGETLHDG